MPFPTTDQCVTAAERALGVTLPAEYRQRLMSNNGGMLTTAGHDWQVFPVQDDSDARRAEDTRNHLVLRARAVSAFKGMPAGALAIASNKQGDLLVLLPVAGTARLDGRVHLWDSAAGQVTPTALDFS